MTGYGAFDRLRVVVTGDGLAGSYAAKLFGDHGAEVVRLGAGPTGPGIEAFDGSVTRTNDASVLERADVVIASQATDPVPEFPRTRSASQVVVVLSPFAGTGPYARWRSTDLVDVAIGGHLRLSGDPGREPLASVPDLVHLASGLMGFIGAVAALIARVRTGSGQRVEVSHHEVIVALHQFTLCRFTHNGAVLNRLGNRYAGPGSPIGGYECADGWVGMALPQEDQMERLLEVTGLTWLLERPDIDSLVDLMTNPTVLDGALRPYLRTQPRDATVELFQALRLPCAPVSRMQDLLDDPHLEARGFWQDGASARLAGAPFRLTGHGWSIGPKLARGVLASGTEALSDLAHGPLTGIRVLDMTRVWAGPLAARILADLGAEVVMTEVPWTRGPRQVEDAYVIGTHFFPDDEAGERPYNRNGFHNKFANNKRSAVIELDKPEGRDLFARLVPWADVLVENYSPRVMPGFGFGAEALAELNPRLVYVTMPGYGRTGPHSDWVAYGPTIDGHAGHTDLTGYRDEGPWKCGIAWPDPIAGMHAAAAALIGLLDRAVDPAGRGQCAEVAQIEAAVNMIGHHVAAAQIDGPPRRWGNRRAGRAPQGVYPCAGVDRWIAISVVDDAAWHGLCRVAGWEDLAGLTGAERWDRHDDLDARIEEWTARWDDVELMTLLQEAGVPAGAALAAPEIMGDPQLEAVGMFRELDHVEAGAHRWPRLPIRLSATPATLRRPAALMGEDNEYVALELAGLEDHAYRALLDAGIVRDEPPM